MLRGAETIQKWRQGEERIKIYYIYRAVLAKNKTIISDPDRKFQRSCTGNQNFGLSFYKKSCNKDRERLLTKICSDKADLVLNQNI